MCAGMPRGRTGSAHAGIGTRGAASARRSAASDVTDFLCCRGVVGILLRTEARQHASVEARLSVAHSELYWHGSCTAAALLAERVARLLHRDGGGASGTLVEPRAALEETDAAMAFESTSPPIVVDTKPARPPEKENSTPQRRERVRERSQPAGGAAAARIAVGRRAARGRGGGGKSRFLRGVANDGKDEADGCDDDLDGFIKGNDEAESESATSSEEAESSGEEEESSGEEATSSGEEKAESSGEEEEESGSEASGEASDDHDCAPGDGSECSGADSARAHCRRHRAPGSL